MHQRHNLFDVLFEEVSSFSFKMNIVFKEHWVKHVLDLDVFFYAASLTFDQMQIPRFLHPPESDLSYIHGNER